jgi:signal transduction histidine kinase
MIGNPRAIAEMIPRPFTTQYQHHVLQWFETDENRDLADSKKGAWWERPSENQRIAQRRAALMAEHGLQDADDCSTFSESLQAFMTALRDLPELGYTLFARSPEEPLPPDQYDTADKAYRRLARISADMRRALAIVRLDAAAEMRDDKVLEALGELTEILAACDALVQGLAESLRSVPLIQPVLISAPEITLAPHGHADVDARVISES